MACQASYARRRPRVADRYRPMLIPDKFQQAYARRSQHKLPRTPGHRRARRAVPAASFHLISQAAGPLAKTRAFGLFMLNIGRSGALSRKQATLLGERANPSVLAARR